jgi:integrase/recombinase XerD
MSNKVARKIARETPAAKSRERSDGASLYAVDGGRKYLNRAERERALAAAELLCPDEALFVLTLAWTGARVSEVLALTPGSIQVEAGVVAITTLKRRRHVVREVPVPESLMVALDFHFLLRAAQRDPTISSRRLWPWHRATAWRAVKDVMRRANVTGRPACPRGFRHGFGVGNVQAGVPLNFVQRWLGHAKIETTAIYASACGPDEREIAGRFWSS